MKTKQCYIIIIIICANYAVWQHHYYDGFVMVYVCVAVWVCMMLAR